MVSPDSPVAGASRSAPAPAV